MSVVAINPWRVIVSALLGLTVSATTGCAVVAVADAAVTVASTAVSFTATAVETTVNVAAVGVNAVAGDDEDRTVPAELLGQLQVLCRLHRRADGGVAQPVRRGVLEQVSPTGTLEPVDDRHNGATA